MDVLDRADLPFPHSLPEFQRLFPDDAACAAYLEKARWGDGFACPHCGTAGEPFHFENRPGVLRCRKCRQNTGLTVGTVMERSHCSTPSAHCSASRATPLLQPMPSFTRESGGTLHVAVMGVNRIGKDSCKDIGVGNRSNIFTSMISQERASSSLEPEGE